MSLSRIIALTLVSATWVAAILLYMGNTVVGRVGAWVFFVAKGLVVILTLLSILKNRALAWQIFCGRYRFDSHRRHGLTQAVTRFTWELPQLLLGYTIAQVRAICGNVNCALMQTGTDEQVRESAMYALRSGKPGGGYIFSTSNVPFRGLDLDRYMMIQKIWREHRMYTDADRIYQPKG